MTRHLASLFVCGAMVIGIVPDACSQEKDPAIEVVDSYLEALGGREKLKSVASYRVEAREDFKATDGERENGSRYVSTLNAKGNRWFVENEDGSEYGYDGKSYWQKDVSGKVTEKPDIRHRQIWWDPVSIPLHLSSFPGTFSFEGRRRVNGKTQIVVSIKPLTSTPRGRIRMSPKEMLFDEETRLLSQLTFEFGKTEFLNYKEVDGIQVPMKIMSKYETGIFTSRVETDVTSIRFDVELEDDRLAPPIDEK